MLCRANEKSSSFNKKITLLKKIVLPRNEKKSSANKKMSINQEVMFMNQITFFFLLIILLLFITIY